MLPNSCAFRSSDEKEILTLISKFSTKKAIGLNGIPTDISQYINKIIAKSILTGQYREKLKISKTIPIFKKGSRLLPSQMLWIEKKLFVAYLSIYKRP